MKRCLGIIAAFGLFFASAAHAMTSTNFIVNWDSLNSGGDDVSSSTNFQVRDTIGEQAVSTGTSSNFQLYAGYRFGDTEATVLTFDVGTQENSTETAFTAFDDSANTVTVNSTSSFSVGNFVGVIENVGASELIAIGKVTSISGAVITVDDWDGNPAAVSASPSGGNDFVYRLQGDAAQLGTLSSSAVATSLTHTTVQTNVSGGYTVYVSADGDLTTGSNAIDAVSDGAVTAGSEEYGARIFGTTATSTGSDFAFATTTREIQMATSTATGHRIGLVYKASISASTAGGSYSQAVTYTVTGNY